MDTMTRAIAPFVVANNCVLAAIFLSKEQESKLPTPFSTIKQSLQGGFDEFITEISQQFHSLMG